MKRIAILVVIVVLITACEKKSDDKFGKLEKMNWLIGSWEQVLPDGTLKETWTKENDSTFSADSYFINPKDTLHFESIKLVQKADDLTYFATIIGQNNDEPVAFKLTSAVKNTFTFENPSHDYPQKITYKKVASDRLIATISGKQQGKQTQESYPMSKK